MKFVEHLKQEELTPLHAYLKKLVVDKVRASRDAMADYYPVWDLCHKAYKQKIDVSAKDIEDKARGLPRKIITPLTFANIQTAVAWCFLLLKQKEKFYEFTPVEGQDHNVKQCSETLVQRDWDKSVGDQILLEFLRNIFRFGVGVVSETWDQDVSYVSTTTKTQDPEVLGVKVGEGTIVNGFQKVVKFEGNRLRTISPYKWFPDPSFHINDWKKGEFVAIEEEYGLGQLQRMEKSNMVHGIGFLKNFTMSDLESSKRIQTSRFTAIKPDRLNGANNITEYYSWFIPKETKVEGDSEVLGEEEFPVLYMIWVANDQRIIRCEPLNCVHNEFPLSVGFFAPDQHDPEPMSLAGINEELQAMHSWLFNSRVAAVTRTIDAQIIVDPTMVEMSTIENRQRIIKLTKRAGQRDVRSLFQQLPIQDTTQSHFQDMAVVKDLVQSVSGVNENMMGIVSGGRRSATEMRNVTGGASSRMKIIISIAWTSALVPLANRMRSNLRQAISEDHFVKVCGEQARAYFEQFRSTPEALASEYDFMVLDGTLPSEKSFTAQQLQEVLVMCLSNPDSALTFEIDIKKLFKKIMILRGLGSMEDVSMDPQTLLAAQQQKQIQLQMMEQAKQISAPTITK